MLLSPMRFKDYVWPHNPRVYEIEFRRSVISHKVPMGGYALQTMGRTHRVLKGEGEFAGPGAYDEFRKLGTIFYEETPGILVHPIWQESKAYFVSLSLRQEPKEDYVSYSFEFWECFEDQNEAPALRLVHESAAGGQADGNTAGNTAGSSAEEKVYTAVYGDSLWAIAVRNGMTLNELLALNPQIKNPNILYPGDRIRIG